MAVESRTNLWKVADELAGLGDDAADVSALAHPREFPIVDGRPVHDDGGYRLHTVGAFAAGFALDQPGEELSCVHGHGYHLGFKFKVWIDVCVRKLQ